MGSPEIYVNYNYEVDYKKYRDGPYQKSPYLSIKIPSRDTLMSKDKSFMPFNRPNI